MKKQIRVLFIGIIISSIFIQGCNLNEKKQKEKVIQNIDNLINSLPFLKSEKTAIINNKLTICYIDSVDFNQPFIESEIFFYIIKGNIDFLDGKIDSIEIKKKYPNRAKYPEYCNIYNINILNYNEEIKRLDNEKYFKQVEALLYDRNSRSEAITLVLFNYYYGYFLESSPKDDIIYNENFFNLLYDYIIERQNGVVNEANDIIIKIRGEIITLPNNEYPLMIINNIIE